MMQFYWKSVGSDEDEDDDDDDACQTHE